MTHLTPDELIDAVDGVLAGERSAHLAACEECRAQLDDLSAVLNDARQVAVPEPSPLFWQHLSARVNEGIESEPAGAWPGWLRWQVLLPLGAAAMVILGLMMAVPKQDPRIASAAYEDAVVEPGPAADDNWGVVATLVGDLDLDTAAATGVIGPGVADRAVLALTAEEQLELTRLLQAELARAKS
ncbi:MAG: hypothetical protein RLZZ53_2981 [Acidobacteriota bacterium]|jgi:hypothetical protein